MKSAIWRSLGGENVNKLSALHSGDRMYITRSFCERSCLARSNICTRTQLQCCGIFGVMQIVITNSCFGLLRNNDMTLRCG